MKQKPLNKQLEEMSQLKTNQVLTIMIIKQIEYVCLLTYKEQTFNSLHSLFIYNSFKLWLQLSLSVFVLGFQIPSVPTIIKQICFSVFILIY